MKVLASTDEMILQKYMSPNYENKHDQKKTTKNTLSSV